MEIILIILLATAVIYGGICTFLFNKLYKRHVDVEKFILGLNRDVNDFKIAVDNLTKSNIMVYDEIVFEVVENCKVVKTQLDQYLSKYDEYGNYIYTVEPTEEEMQKAILGRVDIGWKK